MQHKSKDTLQVCGDSQTKQANKCVVTVNLTSKDDNGQAWSWSVRLQQACWLRNTLKMWYKCLLSVSGSTTQTA